MQEGGFRFALQASALGYLAVALPVITCIVSMFLTLVGVTLIASARQRDEHHPGLLRATLLASLPGALLAGYVLFAFIVHAVRSGA